MQLSGGEPIEEETMKAVLIAAAAIGVAVAPGRSSPVETDTKEMDG
jgi:hypothetical protein